MGVPHATRGIRTVGICAVLLVAVLALGAVLLLDGAEPLRRAPARTA